MALKKINEDDLVELAWLRGTIEGLKPSGSREFPEEFEELFKQKKDASQQKYEQAEENSNNKISALQSKITIKEDEWQASDARIRVQQEKYGTTLVTNYLLWVGGLNIMSLPSLLNLMRSGSAGATIVIDASIIQAVENFFKTFSGKPWYVVLIFLIPILIVAGISIVRMISRFRESERTAIYFEVAQKLSAALISVEAIFVIHLSQNRDYLTSVVAGALGLPSCALLFLIFLKTKLDSLLPATLRLRAPGTDGKKPLYFIAVFVVPALFVVALFRFLPFEILYICSIGSIIGLIPGLVFEAAYLQKFLIEVSLGLSSSDLKKAQDENSETRSKNIDDQESQNMKYLQIKNAFLSAFDNMKTMATKGEAEISAKNDGCK